MKVQLSWLHLMGSLISSKQLAQRIIDFCGDVRQKGNVIICIGCEKLKMFPEKKFIGAGSSY